FQFIGGIGGLRRENHGKVVLPPRVLALYTPQARWFDKGHGVPVASAGEYQEEEMRMVQTGRPGGAIGKRPHNGSKGTLRQTSSADLRSNGCALGGSYGSTGDICSVDRFHSLVA